ncbi:MAG: hypothetical protein JJE39_03710 [Vicinamibacteria bacterium]|nr:hypothetical protein [Vicinamibacteria bacterium]
MRHPLRLGEREALGVSQAAVEGVGGPGAARGPDLAQEIVGDVARRVWTVAALSAREAV